MTPQEFDDFTRKMGEAWARLAMENRLPWPTTRWGRLRGFIRSLRWRIPAAWRVLRTGESE